jgi:hypothetical protein
MLHIYLPIDYKAARAIPFTQFSEFAQKTALSNLPVMGNDGAMKSFYAVERDVAGVRVTMNRPQKTRQGGSLLFKWNVCKGKRGFVWGGDIKFDLFQVDPDTSLPWVIRYKTAKASMKLDEASFAHDISLVEEAVTLLIKTHMKAKNNSDLRNLADTDLNMGKQIAPTLIKARQKHIDQSAQKARDDKDLQDRMSALPDGTPLVVRTSDYRVWQLGLKQGRMPLSLARNARIASSSDLRQPEVQQAGLSMHDILHLDVAGRAATKDFSYAINFQASTSDLVYDAKLHSGQPFHESFMTGRRAPTTAGLIQTRAPSYRGVSIKMSETGINWRSSAYSGHSQDTTKLPYPNPEAGVIRIKEVHRWRSPEDNILHPFNRYGGLWCVEAKAVEILKQHNIPGFHFQPLEIIDARGEPFPGDWSYLTLEAPVNAILKDLCAPETIDSVRIRDIKPYEIVLDARKIEGLDMWFDDTIRGGLMCFSEKLAKALKKGKVYPQIALKPCAAA